MVTCAQCAFYLKEFSICTSGFILPVDPAGGCISFAEEKERDSPCKQLTPKQFSLLKGTDMAMKWDADGWLTDVGVRGLSRVEPLHPIPREPITFSYYDQKACGKLVYSRNPDNPSILVFTPLMNDQHFTVYKQWNANRFPPGSESKRIPAMAVPTHLESMRQIAHLIASRVKDGTSVSTKLNRSLSADIFSVPADLERTRKLWASKGYPVGEIGLPSGQTTTYFAYHHDRSQAVVFIQTEALVGINIYEIAERMDIPISQEDEVLGALRLSDRCILCGHVHLSPFDINPVCEFCLRRGSQIVFKPKKIA